MAKLKLELEEDVQLKLLGIQSNWPEHKLVWAVNRQLGIHLQRAEDFMLDAGTMASKEMLFEAETKHLFSVFVFEQDEEQAILVANIGQGMALYDKKRKLDYILKLNSNRIEEADCILSLSEVRGILAVTRIECNANEPVGRAFSEFI